MFFYYLDRPELLRYLVRHNLVYLIDQSLDYAENIHHMNLTLSNSMLEFSEKCVHILNERTNGTKNL